MKSVEQKLFEAWQRGKPVTLSAINVDDLIQLDDAIRSRITNAACLEVGVGEGLGDGLLNGSGETWEQLKGRMAR